jgi:helix-turn-helix protein
LSAPLGPERRRAARLAARRAKPETAPPRAKRDVMLSNEIKRVFNVNFQVYCVRKIWRQLPREGHNVSRCTMARLMKKDTQYQSGDGRRCRPSLGPFAALLVTATRRRWRHFNRRDFDRW